MNENIKEKLKKGVAYSAILLSAPTIGIVRGNLAFYILKKL